MFVVSCEMRPASELDSKFVATGKPPERKDEVELAKHSARVRRQQFRSCYKQP
jgi:hypothetical protein